MRYAVGSSWQLKPRRLFLEKPLVARSGQDNVTEQDFATAQALMAQFHAQGCQTAMIFNPKAPKPVGETPE